VDREVANLLSTARQQWRRDDRSGAMTSLASASKLKPTDAEIPRVSRGFIQEMADRASNAATAARNATAPDGPGTPFADGRKRQQEAQQLERTGKFADSVRTYGEAIDLFAKALITGRPAVAARGTPPPGTPPPTSPPPGTPPPTTNAGTPTSGRATPPIADPPPPPVAVVTPPPPPPVVATPPPSAPATVVNEEAAIRQVIQRYQAAYESRNAQAAKAVNPSIDARKLADTFKDYTSLKYEIQISRVDVNTDGQSASVAGTVTSQPTAKTGTPKPSKSNAVFRLRKSGDGWLIQDVTFR
jgi:ketosteroid isomerase-like protein